MTYILETFVLESPGGGAILGRDVPPPHTHKPTASDVLSEPEVHHDQYRCCDEVDNEVGGEPCAEEVVQC